MSFLVVAPDWVESAAADLESIRSSLNAAHVAAAVPTTAIAAAGADEVSAAVAALFGRFGQEYQTLNAQASAFHRQFVQALTSGAGSYLATEAANSSPLQTIEQNVLGVINAPTGAANSPLQAIEQRVLGVINAPTEILFGRPLIPTGPTASLGGNISGGTATAPLTIVAGTEPVVNATVGSGAPVRLLVDTGSTGLVVPFQNAGGVLGVLQLGLPTGFGLGGYSGGLDYLYATYNAPVNFGGGLVTARTPVNIEFFAFPTSIQSAINNGFTFQSFFASDGVSGVLGVGPNAGGPGPSIPLQALPSPYNQGLLINEATASPYLQFGPPPTNLGTPIATLTGAPITTLNVSVNGAPVQAVSSIVDSGGVQGTIPFNAAVGSLINVTDPTTGQLLYSYTLDQTYSPIASSGLMNTGALPFLNHPVYINYVNGQQEFFS